MDRRTFVKASVATSVAGAGTAAGLGMAKPLARQLEGRYERVEYVGAKNVAGPAPRGIPLLPLEVDSEGHLHGRVLDLGDARTNLAWYQYCGHEEAPGLNPETAVTDERLRYYVPGDKAAGGFNPWFADLLGEPMRADHFPEPGFGASGAWRSEGRSGADVISAIVIRTGPDPEDVAGTGKPLTLENAPRNLEDLVRAQVEEVGFLGFVSFCTHFCCVPGWKEAEREAKSKNAWDAILCTCHWSVYDPTTLSGESFLRFVPDEEDER